MQLTQTCTYSSFKSIVMVHSYLSVWHFKAVVSLFAIFESLNQDYFFYSCLHLKGSFVLFLTEFLSSKIVWILTAYVQVLREKSICRLQGFVWNLKHPSAYILIHSLYVLSHYMDILKWGVINLQTSKKVGYSHLGCDTV